MKERFIKSTVNFLKRYNNYSNEEIKKLQYGLEGIYLTITKTLIILFLSLLLGILPEVIIVLILFNIIRYFLFGFHAEKSFECLILSIFNFILIPFVLLQINTSLFVKLTICVLSLLCFLVFAPADTPKRPLKNKKKRIIRKVFTILIGIIYTLFVIVFKNHYMADLIVSSLIISVIVVNPLTYMIFGQTYNNYKRI